QLKADSPSEVVEPLLGTIPQQLKESSDGIRVVGHRVVHGGKAFRAPTQITSKVKEEIAKLAEFAPEHNRLELEVIEAAEKALGPAVPQVAVFDTSFHSTLPEPAAVYPGPLHWLDLGIWRYGFHGISHRYASRRAAEILGSDLGSLRMITCH